MCVNSLALDLDFYFLFSDSSGDPQEDQQEVKPQENWPSYNAPWKGTEKSEYYFGHGPECIPRPFLPGGELYGKEHLDDNEK